MPKQKIFSIDQTTPKWRKTLVSWEGFLFILIVWWAISSTGWISPFVLPTPQKVFSAFVRLLLHENLVAHAGYSILVNFLGYIVAIVLAIPLGFLIGQSSYLRTMFMKPIAAARFITIPALTAIFMALYGTGLNLKVQFLAFGIFLYLLPAVVNRFDEIESIDTLRAQKQHFKLKRLSKFRMQLDFYIPQILSGVFSDIKNLVAASWTYITIVELLNATYGLGFLIYKAVNRHIAVDEQYAVIILIVFIGVAQDSLFRWMDKKLFKYKYVKGYEGGE